MKTWLVIKREYWTRVRKKSFILITLLVPLLIVAFMGIYIGMMMMDSSEQKIAVIDDSGKISQHLESSKSVKYYNLTGTALESAKEIDSLDGVLHIPAFNIKDNSTFDIYSKKQIGLGTQSKIKGDVNDIIVDQRITEAGVDAKLVDELRKETVTIRAIDESGKESKSSIAAAIGTISGLILYMFMFMYGFTVMQSVMEEKTNRIAEIIVSSIKPFQLMLGKIIGVALVGLTQFFLWVILIAIISTVASTIFASAGFLNNPEMASKMAEEAAAAQSGGIGTEQIQAILQNFNEIPWFSLISWFIFYFLGGYFLYAALFAAVGSLVDQDAQESQSLTFPITMPIILGFMISMSAIKDPTSNLAIFGSIFPLTSPMVMMGRIAYGIKGDMLWQLPLSAILLVGGFILTTWIAAKIYRTGILMYGKKVTLKEVGKWIFKKTV